MSETQRIAVIEDNTPQRTILVRLLGSEHEVLDFSSGEEFFASAPEVDVVLLDIEMPGLNGYQTCQRLRRGEGDRRTPVIFVSAHDSAPERVAAYEAGGDDFLTNPFSANELRHKVATVLGVQSRMRALYERSSVAQQVARSAFPAAAGDWRDIAGFEKPGHDALEKNEGESFDDSESRRRIAGCLPEIAVQYGLDRTSRVLCSGDGAHGHRRSP